MVRYTMVSSLLLRIFRVPQDDLVRSAPVGKLSIRGLAFGIKGALPLRIKVSRCGLADAF